MTIKTQRILTRAKKLIKKGEFDNAKELYSSILKSFPDNQEAKKELLKLDQFHNKNPKKEQLDAVMKLFSSNEMEKALSSVNVLIKEYPNDSLLFNISGACYSEIGIIESAIKSFERAIILKPEYAEAHFNLGVVFQKIHQIDNSIMSYEKAINLNHSYPAAHNNLGVIYLGKGEFDYAVKSFEWAIAYSPNYAEAHNNLGKAFQENKQFEKAKVQFEKAIALNSSYTQAYNNLGILCEVLGFPKEALNYYQNAINANPEFVEAYRNLSKINKFKVTDPLISKMKSLMTSGKLNLPDKARLCFALAKVNEDLDNQEEFFKFLHQGNEIRKEVLNYSILESKKFHIKLKEIFSNPIPKITQKSTKESCIEPIFIVGMPRSGTSLVEQILATHHKVYGAGELTNLRDIISPIIENKFSQDNNTLLKEDVVKIGQKYTNSLSQLKVDETIVTDKMPNNFRLIGFILSALPKAKIIHVKRDARATCWSNYKHYFTDGNGFTYNQKDLVQFYTLYSELMDFWHTLYPNKIYNICYEDLTTNQEPETRKLLDYCELEWDDNCLNFHKNKRAVLTASSSQVRQKMYQGSSEAWKKYENYLQPLIEGLKSY